jgi:HlyD family secretion protein
MKKAIIWVVVLLVIGVAVWRIFFVGATEATGYEFTTIQRGNLENLVSSTGSLEPVRSVEVGTQVSGIIDRVLVNYNDEVTVGQVLANIDTLQLGIKYRSALADVESAQAQYELSKLTLADTKRLYDASFVSERDYQTAATEVKTKKAALQRAQTSLETAELNLYHYAVITSPINGTVVSRSIEPGQTVAASFSSPVLFEIAEDLRKMEIQALVDESDIGQIQPGQKARYTVEAFPDEEFSGTVREIRLDPTVESNVVNYTVIVDTDNPQKRLLPGMTATIDFVVEEINDVLLVPNAALRYQPDREVMMAAMQRMRDARQGQTQRPSSMPESMQQQAMQQQRNSSEMGRLWYINDQGELSLSIVKLGASDGSHTVVSNRRDTLEGREIILKEASGSKKDEGPDPRMMMRMRL